jgi:hypothetical protein
MVGDVSAHTSYDDDYAQETEDTGAGDGSDDGEGNGSAGIGGFF